MPFVMLPDIFMPTTPRLGCRFHRLLRALVAAAKIGEDAGCLPRYYGRIEGVGSAFVLTDRMMGFTRLVRGTGMADRLDFEIDVELETGLITGHAGVPGLIEAFRQTGTAAVIDREVKRKSRRRGLGASQVVESLVAMWAAGGARTEDLDQFRQARRWPCCWGTS
jgi:hypothetical protein